jgi:hypothetical protein
MGMHVIMYLLVVFSLFNVGGTSQEQLPSGFTFREVDSVRQSEILSEMDLTVFSEEPQTSPITCFAVSNQEWLVVGWDQGMQKTVCIYSDTGDFQYGFHFSNNGSFEVDWQDTYVAIISIRGNTRIVFDEKGQCIECREIENTVENSNYLRKNIKDTRCMINGTTYEMSNNGAIRLRPEYEQVIKTTADGETTILFEADSAVGFSFAFTVLFLLIMLFAGIIVISKLKDQTNKKKGFPM